MDEPSLPVAVVARRLGVAPATLRTWDRRYGLGPTAHTAGAHRRYAPADVARLAVMRRLVQQGVPPAEAARAALAVHSPDAVHKPAPPGLGAVPEADRAAALPSPAVLTGQPGIGAIEESGELGHEDRPDSPDARPVLAVPEGPGPAVARGLGRAATALDSAACIAIVRAVLARSGVVGTWQDVLLPLLVSVGDRWEQTGEGVDVEHLLSEAIIVALREVTTGLTAPINGRAVLLACAEDEQHSLPLHVLAAALAERRVGTRLLGQRVPAPALAAAMRRIGPAVVLLWSQLPATGTLGQLTDLPRLRPQPLLALGGPGWGTSVPPVGTVRVQDLQHALRVVDEVVGGPGHRDSR